MSELRDSARVESLEVRNQQLIEENERLRDALRPFIALYDADPDWCDEEHGDRGIATALGSISFQDLRRGKEALKEAEDG